MSMKKTAALAIGLFMAGSVSASASIPDQNAAIGGLLPGMRIEEAVAAYGEPSYDHGEREAFFSNGIVIELEKHMPGVIEEIRIRRGGVSTAAGLSVGAAESAVTEAYGAADRVKYDDGETEYIYYTSDYAKKLKIEVKGGVVTKIKCERRD